MINRLLTAARGKASYIRSNFKTMKTFLHYLLALCALMPLVAHSQSEEGKIKVKVTREINGEKKTFEAEYENEEQMKADPNYQEFVGSENNAFMFHFDDEDFGTLPNGKNFFFQLPDDFDETLMAFPFDSAFAFTPKSEEELRAHLEELRKHHVFTLPPNAPGFSWFLSDSIAEAFDGAAHVFGFSADGQRQAHMIRKVEIKDLDGNEFGKKGAVSKNELLELEGLSFYPNPSDGKFRLRFKVPAQGELEIKIFNIDGREVFSRYFDQFGGTFTEMIDLTGQGSGIYLMEIRLDDNRLTKKIVVN